MTLDKDDIYDIAKAVVKVIEDKDMIKSEENDHASKKVELRSLKTGDVFKAAGYEWIVLNQRIWSQTCFCIMKDFLDDTKPFDEHCNIWKSSSLRQHLQSIRYKIEGNRHDVLQYMERGLLALDGTMANETSSDKVSLLTLDEYRLYRKYLEYPTKFPGNIEWVLLTAVSEENRSAICAVDACGAVKQCYCAKSFNIRPVCTFRSDVLVEKVSD
ncbi:hypothetical protein [Anaerostipes sp. Marseille-Q3525]|uniref:hypothetical protein n=1 Tax=Anaerostipes sp. Marseille-Q3525 TaxID=2758418 RepID=UPI001BA4A2C7|nr:hypothetical protein [Anaerostipes sp. Marseille-Q3525]MBR9961149.1 hypothetical protein [Anaerostipes sp. Marseille-Q3525]